MLPGGPHPPMGWPSPSDGGRNRASGGGIVSGESEPRVGAFYGGGSDFRSLLKDVEEKYSDAFAELGPGALMDLKSHVDSVEDFLLFDGETRTTVKMAAYAKIKSDVSEFCRYYARWFGRPLMERLKAEIYEVLEEAIDWWGRQAVFDAMEGE